MAEDVSISPTSNTDSADTTIDTSNPPDGGDGQGTMSHSDAMNNTQPGADQPNPAAAQPGSQQQADPSQQQQPGGPQKAPQPQTPPASGSAPAPGQPDPAIDHASRVYKFAQALAGGPRYKESIDVNTGEMKREAQPLSRGDIGMAIALEAISGALSGLTQTGPGALGKAAAAGFQTTVAQREQVDKEQDANANADFARHAQVFETNLRMHQNAQTIGRQNLETNQTYVGQFKPLADQLQKDHPEVVKGLVNESDLAKYHVTKDGAIPVNTVPRLDPTTGKQAVNQYDEPQWDTQYLVIDPNFKADNFLTDDDKAEAAKFRLPGFADSDGKPSNLPQSIPMRLSMALNYKSRIAALKLSDGDVSSYYKEMGAEAPSLPDMVQKDPTLVDAMEKFQPLLNATQQNYAKAIGELGAKDPQAAGKILSLYGGTAMVNKFDQQKIDKEEKAKKVADAQAAVEKQKLLMPGQLKLKAGEEAITDSHAVYRAGAGENARLNVQEQHAAANPNSLKVADMVKNPALGNLTVDPNEKPVDGVQQGFVKQLESVSPNLAAELKGIYEGRLTMSAYGLAKNDGQVLAALLTRAYPGYDQSKAGAYDKNRVSFTSGKDGKQIEAGNTTFLHLARLYDTAGSLAVSNPLSSASSVFNQDVQQAMEEVNHAYTDGVMHEDKRAQLEKDFQSSLPWKRQAAAKEVMSLLLDKTSQKQESWTRSKPSPAISDFPLLNRQSQDAIYHVTGRSIDANGRQIQPQQPHPQQPHTPPAGAVSTGKGSDGQTYYLDANHKPMGIVPQ